MKLEARKSPPVADQRARPMVVPQAYQFGLPGERKARLKPNPDDETMLLFRRSRRPRALDLRPGILDEGPAARTAVEIDVRPFRRSDGETIPPGQIVVTQSIVSNNQQNLRIEVCVDPASPEPVPPAPTRGRSSWTTRPSIPRRWNSPWSCRTPACTPPSCSPCWRR